MGIVGMPRTRVYANRAGLVSGDSARAFDMDSATDAMGMSMPSIYGQFFSTPFAAVPTSTSGAKSSATQPPAITPTTTVAFPQLASVMPPRSYSPLHNVMSPYTAALGDTAQAPNLTTVPDVDVRTSVLLRNLPAAFTRSNVLDVLRTQCLAADIDFLYAPWHLKVKRSCGYAFVN